MNAGFMTRWDGNTYTQWSNVDNANLDPFEAYFIQADQTLETDNVTFDLSLRQLAPSQMATESKCIVQLNMTTPTGSDKTTLIVDANESPEYQINHDLEKWVTTGTDNPQIYTKLNGLNFAYNGLPVDNVQNLTVGIYSKTACSTTISATVSQSQSFDQLLLTDNSTGAVTDLLTSDYNFSGGSGTNLNRFSISAKRFDVATQLPSSQLEGVKIKVLNNNIKVSNITEKTKIRIYNMLGALLVDIDTENRELEIPVSASGLVTVQVLQGGKSYTNKTFLLAGKK